MWCVSTGRKPVSQDLVDQVKDTMTDDPLLSLRTVAARLDTSLSTTFNIARKKLKMKPYKIQIVQKLEPRDRPNRQIFARTLLNREENDPHYLNKIGFCDEATFNVGGVVNRHNCRIWGTENPHVLFEKPRVSAKLHVWCFVHVSGVVGPYFFTDPTMNGANYLDMLQMYAIPAIANIPDMVFQQDGAPPYWSREVRAYLDATFGEKMKSGSAFLNWKKMFVRRITDLVKDIWIYTKTKWGSEFSN